MKPNYVTKLLAVFICSLALIYVGFSFVFWDFNPFTWGTQARFLAALIGAGVVFLIALIETSPNAK